VGWPTDRVCNWGGHPTNVGGASFIRLNLCRLRGCKRDKPPRCLCIGYNTVWSELCECNEQTHSRQCCNLLISWRVNACVWYIVAAGLAGSASADQSTVSIHAVVVTSAVGTWLLCQLAWNGGGKFCLVFFDISDEDKIEDCSHQTNNFLHSLRG